MNDTRQPAENGDTPPTFFRSWLKLTRLGYIWGALPLAFIFFLLGDGWTAMRLAHQGYEQTTGTVTEFSCGKSGRVEYTYIGGRYPHHSATGNPGCRRYAAGETVPVYYSTSHPELSVINAAPGKILRYELKVAFLIALLMPPLLSLALVVKARINQPNGYN